SDDNPDDSSSSDNPALPKKPTFGLTNSWDLKWEVDNDRAFSRKDDGIAANQNANKSSLHYRMEAMKAQQNSPYQRDHRFEDRGYGSDAEAQWTRDLFHFGVTGKWNSHEGAYDQFVDEMKAMNSQSGMSDLTTGSTSRAWQDNAQRDSANQSSTPAPVGY